MFEEIERARQDVAVLMNDEWHSPVIDFGCVSSRILWVKFRFSRVKVCVVVMYGPTEMEIEERERFWNYLDRVVDRIGNGYRLCVLGGPNGWVVNRFREGITAGFGVSAENDNGRRVIDFCAESGLFVSNNYLELKSLDKYIRVARGQDGVEVKRMIDLVLVRILRSAFKE